MCQVYRLTVFILVIAYGGTALGQCDCGELFCSPEYQPCADTEVMSLNETVVTLTEELATRASERDTALTNLATANATIDQQSDDINILAEKDANMEFLRAYAQSGSTGWTNVGFPNPCGPYPGIPRCYLD